MVQKTSDKAPAVRGRPRSFNTDKVLAAVRDTFWRNGYAGTSMDQLAAATGLHKPSLYGAFGDKKRLYLAALDHYLADVRADFALAFAHERLFDTITDILDRSISLFLSGERGATGCTGCFMMNTAMTETNEDPEVLKVVRDAMDALDRAMVRRFRLAIEQGELPATADAEALAMIVVAAHYEISARSRAGYSRRELKALADRAIGVVREFGGADGAPSLH